MVPFNYVATLWTPSVAGITAILSATQTFLGKLAISSSDVGAFPGSLAAIRDLPANVGNEANMRAWEAALHALVSAASPDDSEWQAEIGEVRSLTTMVQTGLLTWLRARQQNSGPRDPASVAGQLASAGGGEREIARKAKEEEERELAAMRPCWTQFAKKNPLIAAALEDKLGQKRLLLLKGVFLISLPSSFLQMHNHTV